MTRGGRGYLLGCLLLSACSGSDTPHAPVVPQPLADAAVLPDDDDGFEGCPASIPTFALGMKATGQAGLLGATLLAASSAPPLRYLNDWTIALTHADGSPLPDGFLTNARPFMPVHGHDGIVQPTVVPLASPGQVQVRGLNFNMRGPWEVQLSVSSASTASDYVVFHICVEE